MYLWIITIDCLFNDMLCHIYLGLQVVPVLFCASAEAHRSAFRLNLFCYWCVGSRKCRRRRTDLSFWRKHSFCCAIFIWWDLWYAKIISDYLFFQGIIQSSGRRNDSHHWCSSITAPHRASWITADLDGPLSGQWKTENQPMSSTEHTVAIGCPVIKITGHLKMLLCAISFCSQFLQNHVYKQKQSKISKC